MASNEHQSKAGRKQGSPAKSGSTHIEQHITQNNVLSIFNGLLPSPDVLVRFNEAVPNGAERVFSVVEKHIEARMAVEKALVDARIKDAERSHKSIILGQWLAFIVRMTAIVGGVYLILRCGDGAGAALGCIVASLGTVFSVFRRKK